MSGAKIGGVVFMSGNGRAVLSSGLLPEPDEELDILAHEVIGAAIEVHRHLGPGYLEAVYEDALAIEMTIRRVPFERQVPIAVQYKGHRVGEGRLDFLICDRLVVELKAVDELAPVHRAQVLSYLRTTHHPLGLLINFNVRFLKDGVNRVILTPGPTDPVRRSTF